MKKLFIILLLLPVLAVAQVFSKQEIRAIGLRSGLLFTAGAFDGTAETLRYHYDEFQYVFPRANPQFWNPAISWPNKYKNGDYRQGEKFPLSSTALCWTTDGFHAMRTPRNLLMLTAIVIPLDGKKSFKKYLIELGLYYLSYTGGFTLTYDVIYRKH